MMEKGKFLLGVGNKNFCSLQKAEEWHGFFLKENPA